MDFKKGKDRNSPLEVKSLESLIKANNSIRLIDRFVDSLDLKALGFQINHAGQGRPPYHPSILLKLYIYGYLNGVRSSRKLEESTKLNLEVMWLLGSLSPDHSTISTFRKNHGEEIKAVFKESVSIAIHFDLIGKKLLAGDGTKLRAQNSKKNNYNEKKLDRHLKYIDNKISVYMEELSIGDGNKEVLKKKIKLQEVRKEKYKIIKKHLEESGESQVSLSDPDARLLVTSQKAEVGYNIQSVVDAAYKIPIDYEVTNKNDYSALGGMLERSIDTLRLEELEKKTIKGLFDTGYYSGKELKKAQNLGIEVYVAIPKVSVNNQAPNSAYNLLNFEYDREKDLYICPIGEELTTKGNWLHNRQYKLKQYRTKACKTCPFKIDCTTSKKNGRIISRSEYADYYEQNKKNMASDRTLYRQRQAIVEHPFGTIKRSWGFTYIMTKKGINRAKADVGFMFLSYNLCRIFNILDFETLNKYLIALKKSFFVPLFFRRPLMIIKWFLSHFIFLKPSMKYILTVG